MGPKPALSDECAPCGNARVVESIADTETRAVLGVLGEYRQPLPVTVLAEEVTAELTGKPLKEVTVEECRCRQVLLHHRTLPRLESLGLVRLHTGRTTVELGDTSPLDAFGIDLTQLGADSSFPWEALASVLGNPRRKSVLDVLAAERTSNLEDLATAVAVREHDVPPSRLSDEMVSSTTIQLYHVDLPKLAEVGLVGAEWQEGPIELCEDRLAGLTDYVEIETS